MSYLVGFALFYYLAICCQSVAALPPPNPLAKRHESCDTLQDVVSHLKSALEVKVTSFCSSYLHYPLSTTTVVTATAVITKVTSTTLPNPTTTTSTTSTQSTVTTTTTSIQLPDPTTTVSTVTVTSTTSVIYESPGSPARLRRERDDPMKGADPSRVSLACSCLVTPSTTTITSHVTTSTTTSTTSVLGPVDTDTVTSVLVTEAVSTAFTTISEPPTSTDKATATATYTYAPVIKMCGYRGSYNNNHAVISVPQGIQSVAACMDICESTLGCLSILYSPDTFACALLSEPISQIYVAANYDQYLYDLGCPL